MSHEIKQGYSLKNKALSIGDSWPKNKFHIFILLKFYCIFLNFKKFFIGTLQFY